MHVRKMAKKKKHSPTLLSFKICLKHSAKNYQIHVEKHQMTVIRRASNEEFRMKAIML